MALQKGALWIAYVKNNPHWQTENITFTPDGLKKLFEQTFEGGHSLGLENGRALANKKRGRSGKPNIPDMFNDIFNSNR